MKLQITPASATCRTATVALLLALTPALHAADKIQTSLNDLVFDEEAGKFTSLKDLIWICLFVLPHFPRVSAWRR